LNCHGFEQARLTTEPALALVIETPAWDLTVFQVHTGLLMLKAYSKAEHLLRFEAIAHNTRQLGCGRVPEKFPEIIARLARMARGSAPDDYLLPHSETMTACRGVLCPARPARLA
jgi:hypothetical protein